MATITQHAPGTFCWPELATTDHASAKKFYGSLFGWGGIDNDMGPDGVYTVFTRGQDSVGALYQLKAEEQKQMPPHWNSYVAVTDADQSAARAKELGATLMMEPFDVMDLGRMAVIQDPTGAVFCLWQGKKNIGASVLGETGSLIWTELMTGDTAKAKAFYTSLFPWTANDTPMDNFVYTRFERSNAVGAGGMMQLPHPSIPPHWMPYFGVENVDRSYAKATELGAETIMPINRIPVGAFAILKDPQGAVFALFQPSM